MFGFKWPAGSRGEAKQREGQERDLVRLEEETASLQRRSEGERGIIKSYGSKTLHGMSIPTSEEKPRSFRGQLLEEIADSWSLEGQEGVNATIEKYIRKAMNAGRPRQTAEKMVKGILDRAQKEEGGI